ncbi:hypothetical protein Tco_1188557 [Tanacetum coccineum]
MDLIIQYLTIGSLPDDQTEAWKIRIKAPHYTIKEGILYRKGYLTSWLRCVDSEEADYVLKEVHFRSCRAQARACSIAQKAESVANPLQICNGFATDLYRSVNAPWKFKLQRISNGVKRIATVFQQRKIRSKLATDFTTDRIPIRFCYGRHCKKIAMDNIGYEKREFSAECNRNDFVAIPLQKTALLEEKK